MTADPATYSVGLDNGNCLTHSVLVPNLKLAAERDKSA